MKGREKKRGQKERQREREKERKEKKEAKRERVKGIERKAKRKAKKKRKKGMKKKGRKQERKKARRKRGEIVQWKGSQWARDQPHTMQICHKLLPFLNFFWGCFFFIIKIGRQVEKYIKELARACSPTHNTFS